jgi:hypothetical protein
LSLNKEKCKIRAEKFGRFKKSAYLCTAFENNANRHKAQEGWVSG